MQFDNHTLKQWEEVVASVNKEHIPLHCVKKLILRLRHKKQKTINLLNLRKNGVDDEGIEDAVAQQLIDYQHDIINIDFVIDVESVAELIQPYTDKLLKDL